MKRSGTSVTSLGLAVLLAACGSGDSQVSGTGGSTNGGVQATGGGTNGGAQNTGGATNGGSQNTGGGTSGGAQNTGGGTSGGAQNTGGSTGGGTPNTGGSTNGGAPATGGGTSGGAPATGGATNPGTGGAVVAASALVTSASGNYWKTGTWTEAASGNADVTVNDGSAGQTWDGFGGAFNEMGWNQLTTKELQDEAMGLLFGADGCNFAWGRIPMGASDYGLSRYTCDDTDTDVIPDGTESNRPPADTSLSKFSLARDNEKLIPYIKAALAVKSDIRFWASPWTPPVWMKTGYKKDANGSGTAKKASYFDGGTMKSDAEILTAYAQYFTKFVQGYKDLGIKIEVVSPQNEPGYATNYPSCLWDKTNYTNFIGKYLGPAMGTLGIKVMAGTLSNSDSGKDIDSAQAAIADATAKGFLSVVGAQWGVLDKVNSGTSFGGLPVWASEHMCGNYPWNPSGSPAYNSTQAPNDHAYGVESWGYIRNAILKGKVTAYNAWNMVLDKVGKGIDTSRDWAQDSLLTVSGGTITKTAAYYVFRHFSQFVVPGAKVVGTSGGDAVAFKNPDGSIVAVAYSKPAKTNYIVSIGGKKLQFAMPADGWATVKFKP